MTQVVMSEHKQGSLPNSLEYEIQTKRGNYFIQVAWPLCWGEDRVQPAEEDNKPVSTLYLVDGNAYFFTAVDIARRLEFTHSVRSVVVGIGYPRSKMVYDWRRGPDLTPPTPDGKYETPLRPDGTPVTGLKFGEADQFLAFIQSSVMTHVEKTLFPDVQLQTKRKALFGHSYGGIFALNALYTKPTLFDFIIAASPTIAWNKGALVKNQEANFRNRPTPTLPPPSLVLTWGTGADELEQYPDESEEEFKERKSNAEDAKTSQNMAALVARLKDCPGLQNVWSHHFPGEDHGAAAVVGLQRGMIKFLTYLK